MHRLERLLLISFEIGTGCNLKNEHLNCPINKILRKQNAPHLTVETVCKAMDEANELGFKGHFAFHHYNEPLVYIDIIDKIVKLRPQNKYLLWSNGLLVPDIEKKGYSLNIFDQIIFTLYHETDKEMLMDVQRRYKNVEIYLAEMDERLEIYHSNYENIVSCKKPYIELPIDYYGEVCLCTHDWKNSHKLGNILDTSMKDVILGERYQKVLDGAAKIGNNENSPQICRKCRYAHLLETPVLSKVRREE